MSYNTLTRTENVTKNLAFGVISKVFLLGATFLVRTLFIRILGAEYTGVSSLYSNILSLLNLAELGFGSVLTYELYKPLKNNDEETVAALVLLFKKIYTAIIAVILSVGLLLIPFLKYIVKSDLNQQDLLIYYVLYLADSVASYFVAYRTMVIEADQKRYVINLAEIITKFVMYICQSVYLVVTKDFLGYLVIQVVFTVIKNISLHVASLKMYPYLEHISKEASKVQLETSRIYKNAKAMCVTKISTVILNQTDSIIISMLLGTVYVGYYSNYYMLIVYLNSIYNIIVTSIEASVGNLNAELDTQKSYGVYKKIDFLIFCMNVFCVAEYVCIVQDFIAVWIGDGYIQKMSLVAALMITFYFQQAMNTVVTYRQTMGLFEATKKVYPIMAFLNIVLSVGLGVRMGVAGVALATGLSRFFTSFWYEGKVVFEKMGHSLSEYLTKQLLNGVFTVVTVLMAYWLVSLISLRGLIAVIIKALLTGLIVIAMLFTVYHSSDEWKWIIRYINKRVKLRGNI